MYPALHRPVLPPAAGARYQYIDKVICHEDYDEKDLRSPDITLLKLKKPLIFNDDSEKPIELHKPGCRMSRI